MADNNIWDSIMAPSNFFNNILMTKKHPKFFNKY